MPSPNKNKTSTSSVASAPAASTKKVAQPAAPRAFTHEQISERARQLWEADGRPDGRDEEIWYRAERELREVDAGRFANKDALLDKDGDPNDAVDKRLNDLAQPRTDRSATSL